MNSTPQLIDVGDGQQLPIYPDVAIQFLREHAPDGPWSIAVLDPQGRGFMYKQKDGTEGRKQASGRAFYPADAEKCKEYISRACAKGYNVYLHVNEMTLDKRWKDRARKEDIGRALYYVADVDRRLDETPEQCQARVLARLDALKLPPTFAVSSGNGIHVWLKMKTPQPVDGDNGPQTLEVEYRNHWLANELEGDVPCRNIDRILRLPAVINFPDKKKIAKGRKPIATTLLVCEPGRVYEPADLKTFIPKSDKSATSQTAVATPPTDAVTPLANIDDLEQFKVPREVRILIARGWDKDDPTPTFTPWYKRKKPGWESSAWTRSDAVFFLIGHLVGKRVPDGIILNILTDARWEISAHCRDNGGEDYARKQLAHWREKNPPETKADEPPQPNFRDLGRAMLADHPSPMVHLNDEFHFWREGAYNPRETETIRRDTYDYLEKINAMPKPAFVTAMLDAITSLIHLERFDHKPPCWINGKTGPEPREILVCRNGLLHLGSGDLRPHTADYLTHNALDYDFVNDAPEPTEWLKFLAGIFPNEPDCIAALQQWFGYLLTPDTGQQKILVIVGPKRSGKGTISRILTGILGQHNVCSPKLRQFGDTFGLQPLIGKQVAIIGDMRLGSADKAAVAETLLTISGEDYMTIDRKNLAAWEGYLRTRFVIMSNDPPTITDSSGALAGRYIVLQMRQSFYGREDHSLTERLLKERSGILNWAIAGWRSLQGKRLEQPASSGDTVRLINRLSSIVGSFIEDECVLGGECECGKDELYTAFNAWRASEGIEVSMSKDVFYRELYSVTSGKVRDSRGTINGKRAWKLHGVKLVVPLPVQEEIPF